VALGSGSAVCGVGLVDRNTAIAAPAGASLAFATRNASSFGKAGALRVAYSRRASAGVRCAGADGVVVAEEASPAAPAAGHRRQQRGGVIVRASENRPPKPPIFVLNVKPERKVVEYVDKPAITSLENYDFTNLAVDPNHRSGTFPSSSPPLCPSLLLSWGLCVSSVALILRGNICGPCVVTLLNWRPIFEWYMAWLVLKNVDPKETCSYDEIGLCA
jgi:hypothetical protein